MPQMSECVLASARSNTLRPEGGKTENLYRLNSTDNSHAVPRKRKSSLECSGNPTAQERQSQHRMPNE
jgi:hypothetical protein